MRNPMASVMKRIAHAYKNCVLLAVTCLFVSVSSCDQQKQVDEEGFLAGKVTIGPLCPVETFPPDPACQPTEETYMTWPIAVWTTDKSTKLGQIQPDLDGTYRFELSEGSYLVDLEKQHRFGTNLPAIISIKSGETLLLNIDVDTGIR
ncbi:hypothetical protein [Allomuricauda sp. SCSIO 65647]|uniref:hypothetical protein n=1 Tax=Allomuricauda sp. SCSIO 65647 TaxID=2908843 RepID=UPI001F28B985|nr:hypothetical protein [Muricauda sp. SCSIO 65647]UJH68395.1 hypothetical protein L0P89_04105 [Muricauda sp. SCSIO 65647]